MTDDRCPELESRLAALEQAVARLTVPATDAPASIPVTSGSTPDVLPDDLWVLNGLRERGVEGVLMAGALTVPAKGPVAWQYALTADDLLDLDWADAAATLDALSHPARLTILRLVVSGVHSTAALLEQEALGTTGQLHHHLRQLVAAGWLSVVKRGEYAVPAPRVVPLLIMILAAQR